VREVVDEWTHESHEELPARPGREHEADALVADEKVLLVPVTSNRGLCGAFNANVIKQTMRLVNQKYAKQKKNGTLSFICIGKKATEYFRRNNYNVISSHSEVYDNLKFETVAPIAERIMQGYKGGEFDKVEVIYNQFKNAAVQLLITEQFLPVMPPPRESTAKKTTTDYIFEPGKEEIVLELIPKSLKTQLYKAVLDSNASDPGADGRGGSGRCGGMDR